MQYEPFIDLLKSLVRHPSVVGAEHSFFRVLQRELEERGAKVTWYEGLLVAQGDEPDSAMFSAHIDRHGLICTGPNEFQYAAFVTGRRSDLLGNSVSEKLMKKIVDRFQSVPVMAYEPWSGSYRGAGVITRTYVCEFRNNLIFEVEGLEHLVAGTPVAFSDRLSIKDDILSGQLDNVLAAAHLVHLFSLGFKGTAFFTAQEESGSSWRYLLEWFRRFNGGTNRLIVVDTSPYPDREQANRQQLVLRRKDANASFHRETTWRLETLCNKLGLTYSFKDAYIEQHNLQAHKTGGSTLSLGSTEMGRIITASKGFIQGTTLQIPTAGYHTMAETATVAASQAFHSLLLHLAGLEH
ncbi:Putative aminopeptidase FrvX [Malonomonas rubra DSM 5091]|uniref:Putative aminopeptidase FrvX n=1 Tax=Malonomonas rubra DSM 5091 TaxID=1122189 RepID=A0A1M6HL89_MALRU|nr:peptidase M42 [Malonomonas rubra]SHJ22927.1 Putative aminopeptidase FrvX [Malonomonas rubra DSM 5091]